MTISTRDQADLDWFCGAGLAAFERSTCGPMLERAQAFHVKHSVSLEIAEARHRRIVDRRFDLAPPGDLTARPTAEVRESAREEPDHGDLVRYGRVSRRMSMLDYPDQTVLVAYFGDVGARWGRGKYGRIGSLLHLTEAGKRLATRDDKKTRGAKVRQTPEARVETAVVLQDIQPQPARESLLSQGLRQAQELFDRACEAWNYTANDGSKR